MSLKIEVHILDFTTELLYFTLELPNFALKYKRLSCMHATLTRFQNT